MRLILVVLFLLINGCASGGVLMVHPASGEQLQCPLQSGERQVVTGSWAQFTQVLKLIEDQKRDPLNALEFCIKYLENYGYVRAPSN